MKRYSVFCFLCVLLAFVSVPAVADVTYSFSGTNNGLTQSFTLTTPVFIPDYTPLPPFAWKSCSFGNGSPCALLALDSDGASSGPTSYDEIQLSSATDSRFYYFADDSFQNVGTFTAVNGIFNSGVTGTLTVTAVPEPSVALLLLPAFVGIVGVRRKLAK